MGDKCNCYRFSPRDSLSGAVAQIADYLSKHPGWNETELRAFVDGLISSAGVETFNGRSGNVTLNKDDVNNLLIANCYFAEADETIESIDVLALYKLGIRIVFTQYSSEVGGYTLAYGIEYYPTTDTAKAYLFSSGSGGVGAVVSVNGKTGTVFLKAGDILMNNGDSVEDAVSNAKAIANAAYSPDNPPTYPVNSVNNKTGVVQLKVVDVSNGNSPDENAYIFIDESDDYPDVIASNSSKLGGQLPSYYASAEEVSKLKDDIAPLIYNNAGAHNAVYRGKNLGTSVTAAHWAAIADGTFTDMYIGDYWTIGGVTYRIAAFDYYLRAGDTDMTTHHVTLVPDASMYHHVMNDSNVTTGGYVGSKMYTTGLADAKTTINNAFGSAHILTHRQYLCNAVNNGKPSGHSWYDSTVELMTEQNVYGGKVFGVANDGSNLIELFTVDKSQYPLFAFRPDLISNRDWFWLRDVGSAIGFAVVADQGFANYNYASFSSGVRPAFSIKS